MPSFSTSQSRQYLFQFMTPLRAQTSQPPKGVAVYLLHPMNGKNRGRFL